MGLPQRTDNGLFCYIILLLAITCLLNSEHMIRIKELCKRIILNLYHQLSLLLQYKILLVTLEILNSLALLWAFGKAQSETTDSTHRLVDLSFQWPFSEPETGELFSGCSTLCILIGYWNLLILSQYSCLHIFLLLPLATFRDAYGPLRSIVKFCLNCQILSKPRGCLIKHILLSETLQCENMCVLKMMKYSNLLKQSSTLRSQKYLYQWNLNTNLTLKSS